MAEAATQTSITPQDLDRARQQHLRELRLISRMTPEQFEAFKGNFSLGLMDPTLSRRQAIDLLRQMLMTNVSLQSRTR